MPVEVKTIEEINGVNGGPEPPVEVTVQRKPFLQPDDDQRIPHAGPRRRDLAARHLQRVPQAGLRGGALASRGARDPRQLLVPDCGGAGWLPDPFFRVFLADVHRAKHGSDTGAFDAEGRFVPPALRGRVRQVRGGPAIT
ncbi:uncharacterized protein F4812DRAFT_468504 [Daldinia caldariorum]|uniref:uncharacterized protein n=1 Tax=Daldinia caldariorum TaxID=326644 RepID=UPI002007F0C9|nr:uncharacterized protein F4812DRAFT_468504 [Daldinia caldariorum]KAI1463598.1 hypothetical protein F4812DRAFT_468504 [Daldinia caldariorum]